MPETGSSDTNVIEWPAAAFFKYLAADINSCAQRAAQKMLQSSQDELESTTRISHR
jgi:hypothetical protein